MSTRKYVLLAVVLLALAALTSLAGWFVIGPDREVPIHFGPTGADRWAKRTEAVLAMPIAMLVLFLLGLALGRSRAYRTGWVYTVIVTCLGLLAVLHAAILGGPSFPDRTTATVVGVGSGAALLVVAAVLRRNGGTSTLAGVRVPSTVDDRTRTAARRTASTGFFWLGGVMVILGWVLPIWGSSAVLTAGLTVTAAITTWEGARAAPR